jgi:glycosyltransferase involved in cell wall biosynthesis
MPKITVLVSCYNSGQWIQHRLDNLLASSIKNDMEIVCINANSPDERDELIPLKYPVKYIRLPERVGVYEAWNIAIQQTDSKYITNANTDDVVAPMCYERLSSALDNIDCDFAYPSWYVTHLSHRTWTNFGDYDPSGRPGRYHGDIDKAGVGHFPMWKRSLHNKVGLFDPNFKALGDADFWARCYWKGKAKFHWVEELLAIYLWRNGDNLWNRSINEDEWGRYHSNVANYKEGR